jgi:YD repeat-containing protein
VSGLNAANNGNILGQKVNGVARTYTYDAFNRLSSASQGGGQNYTYDSRGNRAATGAGTNSLEVPTNYSAYGSDNRNSNWDYDGSGNVTRIPSTSTGPLIRSATYDAENRMVTETTANGGTATYFYDGEGHRVKKSVTPRGWNAGGHYRGRESQNRYG